MDADETDLYFNVKDLLPEEQQKARSWQVGDLLFSTKNWLDDITKQPMFWDGIVMEHDQGEFLTPIYSR